jgi:hypothetical protein
VARALLDQGKGEPGGGPLEPWRTISDGAEPPPMRWLEAACRYPEASRRGARALHATQTRAPDRSGLQRAPLSTESTPTPPATTTGPQLTQPHAARSGTSEHQDNLSLTKQDPPLPISLNPLLTVAPPCSNSTAVQTLESQAWRLQHPQGGAAACSAHGRNTLSETHGGKHKE